MLILSLAYFAGTVYMYYFNQHSICWFYSYFYFILIYRHILAAIHFNFNLMRRAKESKDDCQRIKVTYPKFKDGEATVTDVKEKQNFGMRVKKTIPTLGHKCGKCFN